MLLTVLLAFPLSAAAEESIVIPNGDFETVNGSNKLPHGWRAYFGKGTRASIEADTSVFHRGKHRCGWPTSRPRPPIFMDILSLRRSRRSVRWPGFFGQQTRLNKVESCGPQDPSKVLPRPLNRQKTLSTR